MEHRTAPDRVLSPTEDEAFLVGERRVSPSLFRLEGPTGAIQLEPRSMQVLVYLSRRAGQVVSREDLLRDVWRDSVVSDEALTRTIFDLRKAFDDSARHPAVIETIRKGGYRLIAQVRPAPPAAGLDAAGPGSSTRLDPRRWLIWGALFVFLVAVFFILAGPRSRAPQRSASQNDARGVAWSGSSAAPRAPGQLTSFRGYETHPALSPDGGQIAFAWGGEERSNVDIYLKAVDSENPLRLTRDPAVDDSPVFSPDGRRLAFIRHTRESCGLFGVDVPGRDVRRLAPCRAAGISPPTWSASADALYYADRDTADQPYRLKRLDLKSRRRRAVTEVNAGLFGDLYPAVSPDGTALAFVRATAKSTVATYLSPATGDLHLLDLDSEGAPSGRPRRLTFDNAEIPGLAWTPDSRRLVFAAKRDERGFALWQVAAAGGAPVPLIEGAGLVRHPAIARRGGGLAYEHWSGATDIRRLSVRMDAGSPEVTMPRSGERLIGSTRSDFNPRYSPDGRRLAFTSARTGFSEIWVSDADGGRPTRLTSFAGDPAEAPRWSPDGEHLAFEVRRDGRSSIWTVAAAGGAPRRVTSPLVDDRAPSWSRDGRSLFFASSRGGSWQVWRRPVVAGEPEQITRRGGFAALESTSASEPGTVYFSKRDLGGIWKVARPRGSEELVVKELSPEQWGNWTLVGEDLFYAELLEDRTTLLHAVDLKTGARRKVTRIEDWIGRETANLSLSPDGRWIAFAQFEGLASDLRYVRDFQ